MVKRDSLTRYLGQQKFFPDVSERINRPGIAVGLAWTPVGGDILFIEATKMEGKGKLILTGQLGDVMKESAQAALSFIAANARKLGISPDFRSKTDIHVHVPAGAIPKDGPSAGVTMLTALTSLLTGRLVRNDLAMTGEITLRGAVLPDRRRQGEGACRAPGGSQDDHPPGAEQDRPGGDPEGRSGRRAYDPVPLRRRR